jgi:hypothetical protein
MRRRDFIKVVGGAADLKTAKALSPVLARNRLVEAAGKYLLLPTGVSSCLK